MAKKKTNSLFNKLPTLNQFQLKELSKLCFNTSLLTLGSLVFKLFEPGIEVTFDKRIYIVLVSAVVIFISLLIIGLFIGSRVKKESENE